MSSAANNPALTGVSDPNPQMMSGGTPAQPPPAAMGAQQLPPPSGTGIPMSTGKGGGPSIPTTPSPPPGRGGRSPGDVRPPDTPGAHMAQGYDIAQGLADTLNRVGQGGGQPPVPLSPRVLDPNRPPLTGPSLPAPYDPFLEQMRGNDPWSTGTVPSPIPDPVMDPAILTGPWLGPQLPNMPPKRQDIRTGPRTKYPSSSSGVLTRPPAIPMRDPTMPSPSTGYSIPFGKRRRGLV